MNQFASSAYVFQKLLALFSHGKTSVGCLHYSQRARTQRTCGQCISYSITGGSNYLVRKPKIIFLNVGIHMFPNGRGQRHLEKNTKGQWGSKEKDSTGQRVRKSHV